MKRKPKAPEELSGPALLAWHDFAAECKDLTTKADRAALILLSRAWAEFEDAERHIEANGTVIKMPNGYPGSNPFCKIRDSARACVLKLLAELGMTPNARSRIAKNMAVDEAETPSEIEF